jgi:hypothetical protein
MNISASLFLSFYGLAVAAPEELPKLTSGSTACRVIKSFLSHNCFLKDEFLAQHWDREYVPLANELISGLVATDQIKDFDHQVTSWQAMVAAYLEACPVFAFKMPSKISSAAMRPEYYQCTGGLQKLFTMRELDLDAPTALAFLPAVVKYYKTLGRNALLSERLILTVLSDARRVVLGLPTFVKSKAVDYEGFDNLQLTEQVLKLWLFYATAVPPWKLLLRQTKQKFIETTFMSLLYPQSQYHAGDLPKLLDIMARQSALELNCKYRDVTLPILYKDFDVMGNCDEDIKIQLLQTQVEWPALFVSWGPKFDWQDALEDMEGHVDRVVLNDPVCLEHMAQACQAVHTAQAMENELLRKGVSSFRFYVIQNCQRALRVCMHQIINRERLIHP